LERLVDDHSYVWPHLRQLLGLLVRVKTRFWEIKEARVKPLFELQSELSRSLHEVDTKLGNACDGLALFIDEADRPSRDAKVGGLLKSLAESLARNTRTRVIIGVAGVSGGQTALEELGADEESPLRSFYRFTLRPLSEVEQLHALERGFAAYRMRNLEETALDESGAVSIIGLAAGDPGRLQELAFRALEADEDDRVDMRDVLRAAFAPVQGIDMRPDRVVMHAPHISAILAVFSALRDYGAGGVSAEELSELITIDNVLLLETLTTLRDCGLVTLSESGRYLVDDAYL
jgi:hypothetical protein